MYLIDCRRARQCFLAIVALCFALMLTVFVDVPSFSAGEKYKPGDVVEVFRNNVNGWETGIVVPYLSSDFPAGRANYFRVWIPSMPTITEGFEIQVKDSRAGNAANLDEVPDRFTDSPPEAALAVLKALGRTLPRDRRSAAVSSAVSHAAASVAPAAPKPQQVDVVPKPAMFGSLPQLAGTTWKQLSDRKSAVVVPLHLFCRSGRWDVVRDYFVGGGMMGSYRVEGSKLILKSSTDGKSDTYSMSYDSAQNVLRLTNATTTLRLSYKGTTECK